MDTVIVEDDAAHVDRLRRTSRRRSGLVPGRPGPQGRRRHGAAGPGRAHARGERGRRPSLRQGRRRPRLPRPLAARGANGYAGPQLLGGWSATPSSARPLDEDGLRAAVQARRRRPLRTDHATSRSPAIRTYEPQLAVETWTQREFNGRARSTTHLCAWPCGRRAVGSRSAAAGSRTRLRAAARVHPDPAARDSAAARCCPPVFAAAARDRTAQAAAQRRLRQPERGRASTSASA